MIELSPVLRIALCSLLTYRIAELITIDEGPGAIFDSFRRYLGRRASVTGSKIIRELALLFQCPFCIGVWIGAISSFLVFFPSAVGDGVLVVGGIVGAQALFSSIGGRFGSND